MVQQVSGFFQARMQRRYTQTAQQQYFVANTIQENCGDIYADAKDINEKREAAADELFFEDASEDASTDVKASDSTVTE